MTGMVPIDKVVRDACREAGDSDYKKYMVYLQYANDAMRDLTQFVIPSLKDFRIRTEMLPCGTNQVIELPADFVYETKVGICKNGITFVLSLNNDMCAPNEVADANCDCTTVNEQANSLFCGTANAGLFPVGYYFYNAWRYGNNLGELYGASLGYNINGYYKIERDKNRMLIRNAPSDSEVVIEYKSNGVGRGAELIPTEAENAIREYMMWKSTRFTSVGVSDRAFRNYKVQYNKLKKLYSSHTEEQWHHVLLQNHTPAIKN